MLMDIVSVLLGLSTVEFIRTLSLSHTRRSSQVAVCSHANDAPYW